MKRCNFCKLEKPLSEFHNSKCHLDGKKYTCKSCRSLEALKYKNKAKKSTARSWHKRLFIDCKKRAKLHNYSLDFDESYILELFEKQNKKCHWYGIEMKPSTKAKYPFQPSIDRIDNSKGYSKDNILLCCFSANMGRNANDYITFKEFADVIKGLKTESIQDNFESRDNRKKFVSGPNGLYFNTIKEASRYLKIDHRNFKRFIKTKSEWKVNTKEAIDEP
jgi:hypothetical protein